MMKSDRIALFVSSGVALLLPVFATAATGGLVPCGTVGATMCRACDLVALIQHVLSFLIGLSIPIAVAMFAWAGILYFTNAANQKNIGKAKRIFKSALWGFVLVISAWLIINTLLNAVLNKSFYTGGSWFYVKCYTPMANTTIGQVFNNTLGALPTPAPAPPSVSAPQCRSGYSYVSQMNECYNASTGDIENPVSGTEGPGGSLSQVSTKTRTGTQTSLGFSTNRSDADLSAAYIRVLNQYAGPIAAACQGSVIPNCKARVTAVIVAESSGNADLPANSKGAIGLMQVLPSNAVGGCDLHDITCNLNSGVKYLTTQYVTFGNDFVNGAAAYNGGPSSAPGSSPSGLTPAMAASQNCSGYYAYQCTTNPGGLVETQYYVADICRTLYLWGQSC